MTKIHDAPKDNPKYLPYDESETYHIVKLTKERKFIRTEGWGSGTMFIKEKLHKCHPPDYSSITYEGWGVGSVWQCACGKTAYEVVRRWGNYRFKIIKPLT